MKKEVFLRIGHGVREYDDYFILENDFLECLEMARGGIWAAPTGLDTCEGIHMDPKAHIGAGLPFA